MSTLITTPVGRGSYVYVMKPRTNKRGVKEYSITLIFDKDTDLSEVKAAIAAARDKLWPNPKTRPKGLWNPIRKCDDQAMVDGSEDEPVYQDGMVPGGHFIRFKADEEHPPKVRDQRVLPVTDPSLIYSGAYFRVSARFYPFDKESKGVGAGLGNVQLIRNGDPLGSTSNPETDFTPVERFEGGAEAGVSASDLDWED